MAITRTQIARQLYRYGGDTMGGPNDKSNEDKADNKEQYGAVGQYEGRAGTRDSDKDEDEGNIVDRILNLSPTKKAIDFFSKLVVLKQKAI